VQFLYSDDLLHPDKIAQQLDSSIPSSAVRFGPWRMFSSLPEINDLVVDRRALDDGSEVVLNHLRGRFIASSSPLWPAELLRRIGGWDPRITANQDGEILVRSLASGAKLHYCENAWSFYRKASEASANLSSNTTHVAIASRLRVLRRMYRWNQYQLANREIAMRFWQKFLELGIALLPTDKVAAKRAFRIASRAQRAAGRDHLNPTLIFAYGMAAAKRLGMKRIERVLDRVIRSYRNLCLSGSIRQNPSKVHPQSTMQRDRQSHSSSAEHRIHV
jgi:hypothetical protein